MRCEGAIGRGMFQRPDGVDALGALSVVEKFLVQKGREDSVASIEADEPALLVDNVNARSDLVNSAIAEHDEKHCGLTAETFHRFDQINRVVGLGDGGFRTEFSACSFRSVSRHNDNWRTPGPIDNLEEGPPVHHGHLEVQDDDCWTVFAQQLQGLNTIARAANLVAFGVEDNLSEVSDCEIVVYHQDPVHVIGTEPAPRTVRYFLSSVRPLNVLEQRLITLDAPRMTWN